MAQIAGGNSRKQAEEHFGSHDGRPNTGLFEKSAKLLPNFSVISLQYRSDRRIALRLSQNFKIQNSSERFLAFDNGIDDQGRDLITNFCSIEILKVFQLVSLPHQFPLHDGFDESLFGGKVVIEVPDAYSAGFRNARNSRAMKSTLNELYLCTIEDFGNPSSLLAAVFEI